MTSKEINVLYENLDKFKTIDYSSDYFKEHIEKWRFFNYAKDLSKIYNIKSDNFYLNIPGKFFLYESIDKERIYYPKLGIFINSIPCDQTLDVEWVNLRRTWEYNLNYKIEHDGKIIENEFIYLPTQIQSKIIWGCDTLLIYDVWDKHPNYKQLRKSYDRTWWFHKTKSENRNIRINQIFT